MIKAERIQIEHMKQPLGIECEKPIVTWNVLGKHKQTAYRVWARGSAGNVFDSGIVKCSQMNCELAVSFQSRERVQVVIELFAGDSSTTEQTWFEMGLKKNEWKALWINTELEYMVNSAAAVSQKLRPASYLKKSFRVNQVSAARLYVTCHGIYNVYINGKHVDGFVMAPGTSQYETMLQYQTYDVSGYLETGNNELIVVLGNGWWRGTVTYDGIQDGFGTDVALLLQLEVDGKIVCMTDDSWQATQEGPIRFTDNMHGEVYDARLEAYLMTSDVSWHGVKVEAFGYKNLCCSNCPPPIEHETFKPELLTTPKNEKVLDFGQNIAGYMGFCIEGKEGDTYTFTHGETLDDEGNFCTENFQSIRYHFEQQIIYTCKEGKNSYKPTNTFMGFRYVKVEGMSVIHPEDFTAYAVYTDLEETAAFTCGNPLVSQLFANAMWSLKGNLLDIPTDCPTREKSGFTGDLQAYVYTMLYMMDSYPMMQKFIANQVAGQWEDGCVRQIVADPGKEKGWWDGAAGWCDSFEVIPMQVGARYDDYRMFETYYPQIKKWVDFLIKRAADETRPANQRNPYHQYLVDTGIHWGEWAEPGFDFMAEIERVGAEGEPEVATAYLSYACQILSQQAGRIGRADDQAYYAEVAENARRAYCYAFVPDGKIASERMCRYIRPIILNLLNEEEKRQAADDLNQLVIKNKYTLNTGFLTTHELCRTLSIYGYIDSAYRLLLNEECPGWLYSVKKGATTIPENWDSYIPTGGVQASFNHYSYGAIAGWLLDTVGGIQVRDGKIIIAPKPYRELIFANASYLSPFGKIQSNWKYQEDGIHYYFEVPGNCEAEMVLPDGRKELLRYGVHEYIGQ